MIKINSQFLIEYFQENLTLKGVSALVDTARPDATRFYVLDPFANGIEFIPLFVGSNTPTSKFSESIVQLQWLECSVEDKLPVKAPLVRAD